MPKYDFNKKCFAILLKSHFAMGVLLWICCIFSEHLFIRRILEGYFCFHQKVFVKQTEQGIEVKVSENKY